MYEKEKKQQDCEELGQIYYKDQSESIHGKSRRSMAATSFFGGNLPETWQAGLANRLTRQEKWKEKN